MSETQQVKEARWRRAKKLADAMLDWQELAKQDQYPRSLVDICVAALSREYRLGMSKHRRRTR
jgi:hypothetical protein